MAVIKSTMARGKRGRPRSPYKKLRWTLSIREEIAAPWELLFTDPVIGKARHNSRNAIIELLLKQTMDAFQRGETTLDLTTVHQLMRAKVVAASDEEIG